MGALGDLIKEAFGDYLLKGTEKTKCIPLGCGFIDEEVLESIPQRGQIFELPTPRVWDYHRVSPGPYSRGPYTAQKTGFLKTSLPAS